jgi:hypothetical protein
VTSPPGSRTYELAGHWQGDHHDGVPIFVLTHDVPDEPPPGSVCYVTDVHECASQARAAAGDGDVMVHGAGAAQALLRAGQLDELERPYRAAERLQPLEDESGPRHRPQPRRPTAGRGRESRADSDRRGRCEPRHPFTDTDMARCRSAI